MARMIPALLPQENDSGAEQTIYHILKRGLPDEFSVIHSLPWLCKAVKEIDASYPPTGEIDFLIVHPEMGVLALEVKGGQYRVEGVTFVNLKSGSPINPVRQTRHNVHGLARWLGGTPGFRLRIGYGFVFPDSAFGDELITAALVDVTANPPQRIFVDKGQMARLSHRVVEIMTYWRAALRNGPLGKDGMSRLIETLCPAYDGTPNWAVRVLYDNEFWLRLTHEQARVVETAYSRSRMVVTGWPGTGKTLIGMEVTRRMTAENRRVLVITYNSLLCDYLKTQLSDNEEQCQVSTWHGLCTTARRKLRRTAEQSQDWLKTECLKDLQEAIDGGLMGAYDALVLDEAQALQPEWCDALVEWFNGKKIIAFCDETQVFPFETGTIKLHELCRKLGAVQPFYLTIVMRMPRAVTDRLLAVRDVSYQITSPREVEPDTAQELLYSEWLSSLYQAIRQLLEDGLQPSEITLLTRLPPAYLSGALAAIVRRTGIRHETLSRFRGLESPAVIIDGADDMDDAELFCAYSRATTVCIALFDAEGLAWKAKGEFHRSVLALGENEALAQTARLQSSTSVMVANEISSVELPIKSAYVAWCPNWRSWLVGLSDRSDPSVTWIDFLSSHFPWPVFYWHSDSRREIGYAVPVSGVLEDLKNSTRYLRRCNVCNELKPHAHFRDPECLFCVSEVPLCVSEPTEDLVNQLVEYDRVIRETNSSSAVTLRKVGQLPVSLAAIGALRYGITRKKRNSVVDAVLPSGRLLYRVALAFVYARISFVPSKTRLNCSLLAEEIYEKYDELKIVSLAEWQRIFANAFGTCFHKGLLTKVSKGIYSPLDD